MNKESGYNLKLELLTILYLLCVSYSRRSGLVGEKVTIQDPSMLVDIRVEKHVGAFESQEGLWTISHNKQSSGQQ